MEREIRKAGSMPTQEERITTLEQTVAALRRDIRSINHQETMLLGMAMKQEEDVREIKISLETFEQGVNNRFETQQRIIESFEQSVNSRLDAHDKRFDALDQKLDQIVTLLNTLANKPE